ncbi:MAG: tyrosine-type recombinase/integrase, partial [Alphaproteobacteria bacterium]|nr:tyrosine-type recombinase/integrase [Alphaproteobacteria bacterium]
MKPKGPHPDKALSAVQVRNLKTPGRYADGNGLYLVVDPSGAKRWVLRTVARGKRRDIGLGGTKLVCLADARDDATALRKIARDGGDPLAARRKDRAVVPTFEEAARTVHTEQAPSWNNAKHSAQWLSSLQAYAFPKIGAMRVDHIEPPDVLRVLSPIWLVRPETARRVRQRIGTVLDWAKTAGHRTDTNPIDGIGKGLPKQPKRTNHYTAMPYEDVPEFIRALRTTETSPPTVLAFEFLILTAARTGEVIGVVWDEIDIDAKTWAIPGGRMKGKAEHRVPLSDRCVEILERAKRLSSGGDYVFVGRSADEPLSNMVFLRTLRRMGLSVTTHGFRSSFRDWASEKTNFPNDVCE